MNSIIETEIELNKCSKDVPFFNFKDEIHLARVTKCYDGDTVHCIFKHNNRYSKFHIRMWKYDSPEMRQSKKKPMNERLLEKKLALDAKKKLEELVLNKNVYLFCKGMDKYGRILGVIKLNLKDKESINDIMIQEGHGYEYYGGTKH